MTVAFVDELSALSDVARQLGANDIARDADAVVARTAANLFYVAFVGQFKRGKSTLINALIGEPLLPTGVVPVTNLITIVRFGEQPLATVRFTNGDELEINVNDLREYVTEERNPGNRKGAALVELDVASPALASGMCLVDTPGLGSIFGENSEVTRRFVPHIDAALLVVGADPPLAGEEAALAEEVRRETPYLFAVLNKADRLPATDVEQAATFTREVLERRLGQPVELFVVSAIERSTRGWPKLEDRLLLLAREAGVEMVSAARERASRRLAASLQREIEERRRALLAPIHDTEQQLTKTRAIVAEAQQSLSDVSFLFAGEQAKISRTLEAERQSFLAMAIPAAEVDLRRLDEREGDFTSARHIAENRISEWLRAMEPRAAAMYSAATERFARVVRHLGGEEIDRHFRERRRFFFTSLSELTSRSPLSGWRMNAAAYLRRLLETNSARVVNDLINRVVESRRLLEQEIAASLSAILSRAERSMQHAGAAQREGHERVAAEIVRLDRLESELNCSSGS